MQLSCCYKVACWYDGLIYYMNPLVFLITYHVMTQCQYLIRLILVVREITQRMDCQSYSIGISCQEDHTEDGLPVIQYWYWLPGRALSGQIASYIVLELIARKITQRMDCQSYSIGISCQGEHSVDRLPVIQYWYWLPGISLRGWIASHIVLGLVVRESTQWTDCQSYSIGIGCQEDHSEDGLPVIQYWDQLSGRALSGQIASHIVLGLVVKKITQSTDCQSYSIGIGCQEGHSEHRLPVIQYWYQLSGRALSGQIASNIVLELIARKITQRMDCQSYSIGISCQGEHSVDRLSVIQYWYWLPGRSLSGQIASHIVLGLVVRETMKKIDCQSI